VKDESQLQAIANSLSQFADDELSKTTKPKLLSTPKLSGLRSREIHQQRSASASISQYNSSLNNDIDMLTTDDPDHDYVYDTYILSSHPASSSNLPAGDDSLSSPAEHPPLAAGNVGYIVITEEDAALWDELLLESEATSDRLKQLDAGGDEDDEDENAEDWYGAEYPEDEVASDDEFGRNEYQYRRGDGEEEWDGRSDVVEWSDGEDGGGGIGGLGKTDMLRMTTEEFLRRLGEADAE
jgi:hypothetical protein